MLSIEILNILDLKENCNNPRKINKKSFLKLKKSIQDFPDMLQYRPIIVKDNIVIAGNQRFKACRELKFENIPAIVADNLSESQIKALIIKDNINNGEWLYEKLVAQWDKDLLEMWDLDVNSLKLPEALEISDVNNSERLESINNNDTVDDDYIVCPKCNYKWNK